MAAKDVSTMDEDTSKEMDELRRAADSEGEIELSLDDDDDDGGGSSEPEVSTRADKKRQRGQNLVQQANEAAETARREAAELRGRLDVLERQRQQPVQQQPAKDPLDDEALTIQREHKAYVTRYNNAIQQAADKKQQLPQAEIDAYEKE